MSTVAEAAFVKSGLCKLDVETLEIIDCDNDFSLISGYDIDDIKNNHLHLSSILVEKDYKKTIPKLIENFNNNKGKVVCVEHELYNPVLGANINVVANIIFNIYTFDNKRAIDIIITDITESKTSYKSTSEKYKEALFMVDTIMGNFGVALINFYPETGEIIFVNNATLELFGYTKEEFEKTYEQNFKYIVNNKEERKNILKSIEEQIKYSESIEITFSTKNSIGSQLWVTCKGRIVEMEGKKICYAGINDITELRLVQDMISEINLRMETLISNIPGGVSMFAVSNGKLQVIYANEEYYRLFGYSRMEYESLPDNDLSEILIKEDVTLIEKSLKKELDFKKPLEYEVRAKKNSGEIIWVSINARYYKHIDEKPMYYAIVMDITARKNIEYELKLQTERYKLIEDATDEFQFEYHAKTNILNLPKKNIETDELVDDNYFADEVIFDYLHPDDVQFFIKNLKNILKKPDKGFIDFRLNRSSNEYEWYRAHYASIENEFGDIDRIVGRYKNIQQEKNEQEKLVEKAKTDPMTGILNKEAIRLTVDDILSSSDIKEEHALLLIDLDKFKDINDKLGHITGDKVILEVVNAMKKIFSSDELLGRAGGDEFVIFKRNANRKKTEKLAQALCKEIKNTYSNEKVEVISSSSIGISYFIEDGFDYNSLFSKADIAMYYSKLQGGDRATSYKEIIDII